MSTPEIIDMNMGPGSDSSCDVNVGGCYYNGVYVPTSAQVTAYQDSHPDPWASNVKYGYYGFYFIVTALAFAVSGASTEACSSLHGLTAACNAELLVWV